jgi:hypothetical protein
MSRSPISPLQESAFRGEAAVVRHNIARGAVSPPDPRDQLASGRPAPAQIAEADAQAIVALLVDLHSYAVLRLKMPSQQWYEIIDQAGDQFTQGFCAALAAQRNNQRRRAGGGT